MSGHPSEPLPSREVERYANSALHVYHRGQSFREYEFKAEDIRLLFPNHRIVFVFPWQSAQKKQNFFAVFTSPQAAAEARQHHKAQAWSVEPVDKHKSSRLVDLLQRIEIPKTRRSQRVPDGPAHYGSSSSPTPPKGKSSEPLAYEALLKSPPARPASRSPSISNTATPRYYDGPPPGWASSSHSPVKRSAHDAFNSPQDLEYPSKRRTRARSSADVSLAVSTATYPSDPSSSSCPSWALEEIDRLRIELVCLKDQYATRPRPIEPEIENLTINQNQERTSHEFSNPPPVFEPVPRHSTPPDAPSGRKSAETRDAGIETDGEIPCAESDTIINDLQQQLDLERKTRLSLESELREARQFSETLSKSEAELHRQLEGMLEKIRHVEIHRGQFEALFVEREQLQARVRMLEASVSASLAQTRSLPSTEDIQMMRGALVAETTRRVNAERERDGIRAAKTDLEARIPAVVQLFKELEGIAARWA